MARTRKTPIKDDQDKASIKDVQDNNNKDGNDRQLNSKSTNETRSAQKRVIIAKGVVAKLLIFSLLMLIMPLSSYYLAVYFDFTPTFGGIAAATMANIVAGGYVLVAFMEKDED